MIRIILIGYMGAGKTTVGRQLALALGCSFYDLDWYIEMRYHRTVAQLFAERGIQGLLPLTDYTLFKWGGPQLDRYFVTEAQAIGIR